ncbi:RNA helicase required for poly(A+) mRNA export, partial [Spiromyces aspiralis]
MHQGFTLDLRKNSPSSSGKAPAGNGSAGGSEKPAPVNQDPTANSSEGKSGDSRLFESKTVVKVKLADKQADPNSPLYSVKKFEELGL